MKDKNKEENSTEDHNIVSPWEVRNKNKDAINYDQVIKQFGCSTIDSDLVEKMEKLTGLKPHHFFRRNIVTGHRGFDILMEELSAGNEFYIYTGRGPSSKNMHIGHAIPFMFTKYLQEVFHCRVVIQITDDEKYFFRENITSLAQAREYAMENIKEIISFGFDPNLTFIFINSNSYQLLCENVLKTAKCMKLNEILSVFGFDDPSTNLGKVMFPLFEIAPAFPSTFGFSPSTNCLVTAAMDQDPYFRLARSKSKMIDEPKPCSIYLKLLPALEGVYAKMSSNNASSSHSLDNSILLIDSPEVVSRKINKYAFSGGGKTIDEHRAFGGNCEVDVPFQYLMFFLENDQELERIHEEYSTGKMSSSEIKAICSKTIQNMLSDFQNRKAKLTEDMFDLFLTPFDRRK